MGWCGVGAWSCSSVTCTRVKCRRVAASQSPCQALVMQKSRNFTSPCFRLGKTTNENQRYRSITKDAFVSSLSYLESRMLTSPQDTKVHLLRPTQPAVRRPHSSTTTLPRKELSDRRCHLRLCHRSLYVAPLWFKRELVRRATNVCAPAQMPSPFEQWPKTTSKTYRCPQRLRSPPTRPMRAL